MKLAELLIEAGETTTTILSETKFIAQDKTSNVVYLYHSSPDKRIGNEDMYSEKSMIETLCQLRSLAEDWETPLSMEDFKAAYQAHLFPSIEITPTTIILDSQEFSHLCIDDLLKKEKQLDDEIKVLENKRCKIVKALNERLENYGKIINNTL